MQMDLKEKILDISNIRQLYQIVYYGIYRETCGAMYLELLCDVSTVSDDSMCREI